jgi:hypothetical protein
VSLSAFELEVLDRVIADYEAVHTIQSDIARDLGRPVSTDEVATALLGLVRAALVEPFVYDAGASSYRCARVDQNPITDLWFLATEEGRSRS